MVSTLNRPPPMNIMHLAEACCSLIVNSPAGYLRVLIQLFAIRWRWKRIDNLLSAWQKQSRVAIEAKRPKPEVPAGLFPLSFQMPYGWDRIAAQKNASRLNDEYPVPKSSMLSRTPIPF